MEGLKKCPFCGGEAKISYLSEKPGYRGTKVECENCGARTKFFIISTEYGSTEEAVKAWNTRSETDA